MSAIQIEEIQSPGRMVAFLAALAARGGGEVVVDSSGRSTPYGHGFLST
jgi:hypothetical protein